VCACVRAHTSPPARRRTCAHNCTCANRDQKHAIKMLLRAPCPLTYTAMHSRNRPIVRARTRAHPPRAARQRTCAHDCPCANGTAYMRSKCSCARACPHSHMQPCIQPASRVCVHARTHPTCGTATDMCARQHLRKREHTREIKMLLLAPCPLTYIAMYSTGQLCVGARARARTPPAARWRTGAHECACAEVSAFTQIKDPCACARRSKPTYVAMQ
jgi:hypothetical protein